MKKVIIIFFTILLSTSICSQQKSNFWENVSYGGGIAIGFGNNNSTIGISPSAIYNFNNGFALGAGLGYLRSRINDFTTTAYNTSIISLYQTNFGIQFSGEFEYYFARQRDNFEIISYGTGSGNDEYTRLSHDSKGNYFDLDFSVFPKEEDYVIKFLFYEDGQYREQRQKFKFRVV